MTDGEAGDETGDVGEAAAQQQEGDQKGHVIGTAEDVLDPELHVGGDRRRRRGSGPRIKDPAPLAFTQDALHGRGPVPPDAREVQMAGRHLEKHLAPDGERSPGGTVETPLVEHSPGRSGERPRFRGDGARRLTRHQLEVASEVGAERRISISARRPGEAGDVERGEPHGDEGSTAADVPARGRRRPVVRAGAGGDQDERDHEPPHDHGSLGTTSISPRRLSSSR